MIVELYKMLLGQLDLSNIGYWYDVILCGGVCFSIILDILIGFVLLSILVKIITKKTIIYWFNKLI